MPSLQRQWKMLDDSVVETLMLITVFPIAQTRCISALDYQPSLLMPRLVAVVQHLDYSKCLVGLSCPWRNISDTRHDSCHQLSSSLQTHQTCSAFKRLSARSASGRQVGAFKNTASIRTSTQEPDLPVEVCSTADRALPSVWLVRCRGRLWHVCPASINHWGLK